MCTSMCNLCTQAQLLALKRTSACTNVRWVAFVWVKGQHTADARNVARVEWVRDTAKRDHMCAAVWCAYVCVSVFVLLVCQCIEKLSRNNPVMHCCRVYASWKTIPGIAYQRHVLHCFVHTIVRGGHSSMQKHSGLCILYAACVLDATNQNQRVVTLENNRIGIHALHIKWVAPSCYATASFRFSDDYISYKYSLGIVFVMRMI